MTIGSQISNRRGGGAAAVSAASPGADAFRVSSMSSLSGRRPPGAVRQRLAASIADPGERGVGRDRRNIAPAALAFDPRGAFNCDVDRRILVGPGRRALS